MRCHINFHRCSFDISSGPPTLSLLTSNHTDHKLVHDWPRNPWYGLDPLKPMGNILNFPDMWTRATDMRLRSSRDASAMVCSHDCVSARGGFARPHPQPSPLSDQSWTDGEIGTLSESNHFLDPKRFIVGNYLVKYNVNVQQSLFFHSRYMIQEIMIYNIY